jgi:2-polyprenyl-3-methyl-5-hydroxy-6-metoxy-1,4-benzoquinol methylase
MVFRSDLPAFAKKLAWDIKYSLFGYAQSGAPGKTIRYLSAQLKKDARILELGCGQGSLLRGIREAGHRYYYCGVDISSRAIEKAKAHPDDRSDWAVSDIESFHSQARWDAILLIESIFYVELTKVPSLLSRWNDMLTDEGFVLIRIHDPLRHCDYMEALRRIVPQSKAVDASLLVLEREPLGPRMRAEASGR